MNNHRKRWSNGDLETLARMLSEGYHYGQIAAHLGRTTQAARKRANKKGLRRCLFWMPSEDRMLRLSRMEGVPYKAIALDLGRTPAACMMRAIKLGVAK